LSFNALPADHVTIAKGEQKDEAALGWPGGGTTFARG
jgi:hypothetical protein